MRLVAPRAGESGEANAFEYGRFEVQIDNGALERTAAVVVSFDGEQLATSNALGYAKDRRIGEVAAGDNDVRGIVVDVALGEVIVGKDEHSHEW